jgi:hypothetical protein
MARPYGSTNGRVPRGGYPQVASVDGAFLAGFAEGEASFGLAQQARGHGAHRCQFSLAVRDDDMDLVRFLADTTRVGRVVPVPARGRSRPQAAWRVAAKSDCVRLTEILDQFPLRGRKSADYAIWRSALGWWIDGDPSARRPNRDWRVMAYLSERLREVKQYGASAPVDYSRDPPGLIGDWPPSWQAS